MSTPTDRLRIQQAEQAADEHPQPRPAIPRAAGILLHPTSLPGPHGIGDLGASAYRFVELLEQARQTIWQMMPLGPVGLGNSPYAASSAFAGFPLLIALDQLMGRGWSRGCFRTDQTRRSLDRSASGRGSGTRRTCSCRTGRASATATCSPAR